MATLIDSSARFDELRRQAERLVDQPLGDSREAPADVLDLIQELKIHQIELEIQNEELRRAQQEISALHREFADLYEFAPCGYVTLNPKGIITRVNLAGDRLLGRDRRSLQFATLTICLAPASQDAYHACLRRASGTGDKQSVELEVLRPDQSQAWVRAEIQAERDADEAVAQWRLALIDITAQKRAEDQLRQSQKLETIGHLAGGIAHEFRNQLTVVQGWAQILRDDLAQDPARCEMLDEILRASERSVTLTGQLLAYSRREMLRPQTVDVSRLIVEFSRSLQRIIRENIVLSLMSPSEPCHASLDAGHFHQAIVNLVVNACDAMPQGGRLTIQTRLAELQLSDADRLPDVKPGRYVEVRVTDTGTGMDEATRGRVFEPFFTTKEVGQGTGLGLSMVYGFVKQSDGLIECQSRMGQGTQFSLYFPAIQHKPIGTLADAEAEAARLPGGRETILIVEDEDAVRGLLAISLRGLGYTVVEASGGAEALRVLDAYVGHVDLLVTDVVMPGMNGVELATCVRGHRPDLAVLYVTGYTDEESLRRAGVSPRESVLTKPVSQRQLAVGVRRLLDARSV